MSTPVTNVKMTIGGNLKKIKVKKLLEVLNDTAEIKITKAQWEEVLKGKTLGSNTTFVFDGWEIQLDCSELTVWVREYDRLENLEDFCIKAKLTFVSECCRAGTDGEGREFEEHCTYQWAPGFGEPQYIENGYDGSERISAQYLKEILRAAKEVRDFKKLPKLINSDSDKVKEFAKEILAGKDILDVVLSGIEGLITKEVSVPEFKII